MRKFLGPILKNNLRNDHFQVNQTVGIDGGSGKPGYPVSRTQGSAFVVASMTGIEADYQFMLDLWNGQRVWEM